MNTPIIASFMGIIVQRALELVQCMVALRVQEGRDHAYAEEIRSWVNYGSLLF
jgi:hypothetical protein